MNKARRQRLVAIAKDRLAYQEFVDVRESLDKAILAMYNKLQKKDSPKLNKKKKKAPEGNGTPGPVDIPKPPPSAHGLGPDDDLHLVVPDQLKQLVETRRQWVGNVGSVFEEKERECPGRIWGLPTKNIYEGLEEAIKHELEKPQLPIIEGSQRTTPQTQGDEMDVG